MPTKSLVILTRIIQKILEDTYIKTMAGLLLSVAAFFFDPATKMALVALLCLIVADLITSLVAIRKTGVNKRGNPLASSSVLGSAIKTCIYFLMIGAGHLVEKAIPLSVIDETIIGFLALTEFISILENTGRAGYAVPRKLLEMLTKIRDEE